VVTALAEFKFGDYDKLPLTPIKMNYDAKKIFLGVVTKPFFFLRQDFTFPIGKVLSRSKKLISRF